MNTPDDTRHDRHVAEELPALVDGALDLDEIRIVTAHLRTCAECRLELVEVAAGISLMRRLDDVPAAASTSAPTVVPLAAPAAPVPARRSRSRATVLIAAAVALVFAGVVTTVAVLTGGSGGSTPTARVALAPVSDPAARGSVAMHPSGEAQAMDVKTSLGTAPDGRYYEVWLLDRTTGKMLPVGVLPPDGSGTYRLSGDILGRYDAVDISLQPDDGTTVHSADSVLRANYS